MIKKIWIYTKRRWLPYLIAYTAKFGLRLLLRTCRFEVEGLDQFISTAAKSPCILMLWHNRLAAVPEIMVKFASQFVFTAFISKSRDGEPLALLTQSYKIGRVLRVPHNGRHLALNKMIQVLKEQREIMIITPDGPRGPRYVLKPGVIMAARESEAKIIPFSWQADRCWILNTWDKMIIPKPFSTLKITFGSSITLEQEKSQDFSQETAQLESALHAISNELNTTKT